MKPHDARPSDIAMRFFTRDLYIRFNSPDQRVADEADLAWESAIRAYRTQIDSIRDRLPAPVRKLAQLDLHDAELLASEQIWSAMAIVFVKRPEAIDALIYVLWDNLREDPSPDGWPASKARPHWLYDEIEYASEDRGTFLHRILLSDGRILQIPFVFAAINNLPLSQQDEDVPVRHTA